MSSVFSVDSSTSAFDRRDEVARRFADVCSFLKQGRLAEAVRHYSGVIQLCPDHLEDLLAADPRRCSKNEDGPALAKALVKAALSLDPENPYAHHRLGLICQRQGDLDEAVYCFEQALMRKADYGEAWSSLGLLLLETKRFEEAIRCLDNVISIDPGDAAAFANRSLAEKALGQLGPALADLDRSLVLNPEATQTQLDRAALLEASGCHEEALNGLMRVIERHGGDAHLLNRIGCLLLEWQRFDEAIVCFDRAIVSDAGLAMAWNNRGLARKALGHFESALADIDRSVALAPTVAATHLNRGTVLKSLYRYEEGLNAYLKALELEGESGDVYNNCGLLLNEIRQFDVALQCFDKAIELKPEAAAYHWHKSMVLLRQGNLADGWALFESRTRLPAAVESYRRAQQRWQGCESLAGKSILLHGEDGLGDTLQFCRYAKLVAAAGARVVLEVPKTLVGLSGSLEGVSEVVEKGAALPPLDYHCPLMSLPHAFGTTLATIPAGIPYLFAARDKAAIWRQKLGPKLKPRVGLVWNGGFRLNQPETWWSNEQRNVAFAKLASLNLAGVDFFSLQKGLVAEAELRELRSSQWPTSNFFDFTGELNDFSDTAALIDQLDLVISVDTSTAHLAGALGKPVWILIRYNACWRWLLDRTDSPWYPTARLYAQTSPGDWDPALTQLRADLVEWASAAITS